MKKLILNAMAAVLMVLGLGGVAMISPAYADDNKSTTTTTKGTGDSLEDCVGDPSCGALFGEEGSTKGVFDNSDLMGTLRTIINVIVAVVGFVAVAMIVLGGISYATSQGDAAKTKKAMNTILYGVVGLVICMLAFAIVNFVLSNVFGNS